MADTTLNGVTDPDALRESFAQNWFDTWELNHLDGVRRIPNEPQPIIVEADYFFSCYPSMIIDGRFLPEWDPAYNGATLKLIKW